MEVAGRGAGRWWMCGIALLWRGVRFQPLQPAADAESPAREQWEGVDESPSAALARSGLHGARLLQGLSDGGNSVATTPDSFLDELTAVLHRRGPDQSAKVPLVVHQDAPAAMCCGSTLGMRGPATAQPVGGPGDSLLLWNGEVFGGGVTVGPQQNDTAALMSELAGRDTAESVVACLASVAGPWACIFWQPSTRSIWFGHDRIGRRSLLLGYSTVGGLAVSSVAPACSQGSTHTWHWQELPPSGVYQLELTGRGGTLGRLHHHHWPDQTSTFRRPDVLPSGDGPSSLESDSTSADEPPDAAASADRLLDALDRAVCRRVEEAPPPTSLKHVDGVLSGARIAVLFSGGVDCMVVAALAHRHRPPDEPIDLLNVAFGSPAQLSGGEGESGNTNNSDRYHTPDRKSAVAGLAELRKIAPTRRWQLICVNRDLDISSLDAGKAEALPLMFPAVTVMDFTIAYALRSAAEGVGLCWSGVDAHHEDAAVATDTSTVQRVEPEPEPESARQLLVSGARILLSGLGADEQCVGYKGRHRTRFAKGGWKALALEIERDIGRLWLRNLGRDDRMIADHGKEVRYPYLDEDVMELLSSLPLWHLADLRLADGVGDKRIIRGVSRRVGLSVAAGLPKRAIQFGSRSSKCFKCNSDGNAHVNTATLSDQTAGRRPKKQRPSYAQRRAAKKNRGTQYPGRKAELVKEQKSGAPTQLDKQLSHQDSGPSTSIESGDRTDDITGVPRRKWSGANAVTVDAFYWEHQVANKPVILCPPLPKSWAALVRLTKGERHQNDTTHRIPDLEALLELVGTDTVVPVDLTVDDHATEGCSDTLSPSDRLKTVRVQKTLGEFAQWWTQRHQSQHGGCAVGSGGQDVQADAAKESIWYLKDWHLARDLAESQERKRLDGNGNDTPLVHGRYLYEPLPHFAEKFDWLNRWWDHLNAEKRRGSTGATTTMSSRDAESSGSYLQEPPGTIDKGRLDDYRFVYLGPKGSWTPLHHDVLASFSWSANLCGIKRWLLFPPEATRLLYDKNGLNLATDAREGSADDQRKDEFPNLAKARCAFSIVSHQQSSYYRTFFTLTLLCQRNVSNGGARPWRDHVRAVWLAPPGAQ